MLCATVLRVPSHSRSRSTSSVFQFSLFQRLDFDLLLGWCFLSVLGYVCLLFSLPSYSVAIGLTQQQGSLAGELFNLDQAFGRPAVGFLSDHFGRISIAFGASLLSGILPLVLWIFAGSMGLIYFFAIAVGLVAGTSLAAVAQVAAEVVGLQHLGVALGILLFVMSPPTLVAEAIAVQLRDDSHELKRYLRIQIFVGSMYLGASACLGWLWLELGKKQSASRVNKVSH
ncbi:hypothetical protein NUU61_001187 [Penicillium alfredii]|uniref:Major facilitator superfamily (MFS) profile domain-containing protein n=1 Tax=Penicillium alfredii TaxID=1506179 RepID=A0A9W9GBJ3_9EURO|nr:uncharacterized protein NUU61_001187 [Penicillium alfredii]KAJ5115428.1 hypothetical protein NUU61_001187 [Penicillium alfredii]